MNIFEIRFSKLAEKQILKLPKYIVDKLYIWVDQVEKLGLLVTRKTRAYHDEPLQGKRKGQRSIRLNRAYRAIYVIKNDGTIEFIEIVEVNKHEY